MKWASALRAPTGVDAVRAAGLFGAIAGAASTFEPYWTGLAEALATVAAVGWVVRARSEPFLGRWGWAPWTVARGVGFGVAAAVLAWGARHPVRFGEGWA
jgi:hypothetical protein